jgi:hypothetical protein
MYRAKYSICRSGGSAFTDSAMDNEVFSGVCVCAYQLPLPRIDDDTYVRLFWEPTGSNLHEISQPVAYEVSIGSIFLSEYMLIGCSIVSLYMLLDQKLR